MHMLASEYLNSLRSRNTPDRFGRRWWKRGSGGCGGNQTGSHDACSQYITRCSVFL